MKKVYLFVICIYSSNLFALNFLDTMEYWGREVHIRIFKDEYKLELFVKDNNKFKFLKSYDVCNYSGDLGPKYYEGDKKSPEGFYFVQTKDLNPRSKFYLSFNINYPNAYDRFHGFTGSNIMVHGDCVSAGCYAMNNNQITEIYHFVDNALRSGQQFVSVNIYPFRMNQLNMQRHKDDSNYYFWQQLKQGYDYFEQHKMPPLVAVEDGIYRLITNN